MDFDNSKRIAKNTLLLYFRMILTMFVSLYTSRVILNTLGVVDYGIYNVVGGVVTIFSFLSTAMASGTQRFLSFELGRKDFESCRKVFSLTLLIHCGIALIILFFAETLGLWFLNNYLNIPVQRMVAARWVFQFVTFSMLVAVIQVPYNASIIAHEKMNVFAYVSILEVALKLLVVFVLTWVEFDKLKLFSILSFSVSFLIAIVYIVFCKKNYQVCTFIFFWDKEMFCRLLSFAGWNLFGTIAWISMGQGMNIVLNVFFGPTVNAARGIAFQVNNAVMTFVSNFRVAVNPQIVKSCAAGNKDYMNKLVFESAKYTYFLLLLFSFPLLLETKMVLSLWLKDVPNHAVLFCKLALFNTLVVSFDGSFLTVFQAYGRIKENQILSGLTYLLILPISYVLLLFYKFPEIVFYLQIAASFFVAFVVKVFLLVKIAGISFRSYVESLIYPSFKVTVAALVIPLFVNLLMRETLTRLVLVCILSFLSVGLSAIFIGMDVAMRQRILNSSKIRSLKIFLEGQVGKSDEKS